MVPNFFRAMDACPLVLHANGSMFRSVVLEGDLSRILKERVGIVVSAEHGSVYARDVHMHSLGMQGVTQEVLKSVADGSFDAEGIPAVTAAALRFAQAAARDPRVASTEELVAAGLSEAEVLEIVGAVQLFCAVNAFTDVMRVPVDEV